MIIATKLQKQVVFFFFLVHFFFSHLQLIIASDTVVFTQLNVVKHYAL